MAWASGMPDAKPLGVMPSRLKIPALLILAILMIPWPATPSPAAGTDRGLLSVEFLYAIEYAGGRSDRLREPMDIFVDRKTGELYIADAAIRKILIYDRNGMFVQAIDPGEKEGSARMVAVDAEGRMFLGHVNSPKISILDFRGNPLDALLLPGIVDAPGSAVRPMAIANGGSGGIYVLKTRGGVVKVDPDGVAHEEIPISGEGAPNTIYGMAVDRNGRFLFTDMRPYSVVIYDPRGKTFKRFGSPGVLYGQLDRPIGIAADDAGHIFVVSTVTNKVSCFDREGEFIEEFGKIGEGYGQFYMPSRIASDGRDRIYVLENTLKRVQVFKVRFLKEKEVVQETKTACTENSQERRIASQSTPNNPLKKANLE
ncbi:MAG: NHL repeat-containing protein [Deltaproteobacteria bacterium]|nr:NHL repeat-containing protein [Deltaproteobacteria bacterium]